MYSRVSYVNLERQTDRQAETERDTERQRQRETEKIETEREKERQRRKSWGGGGGVGGGRSERKSTELLTSYNYCHNVSLFSLTSRLLKQSKFLFTRQ